MRKTKLQKALELADKGKWSAANDLLNGYGIEYVQCGQYELKYINTGDTYSPTICQEGFGRPFIGSWGAWIEETEILIFNEENLIRCPYCGELSSTDKDECEYCGEKIRKHL